MRDTRTNLESTMVPNGSARRMSAALLVACTTYLAVDTFFSLPSYVMEESSRGLRQDSRRNSETEQTSRGLVAFLYCTVEDLHEPEEPIVPVYSAAYPGSGSQMTHYLYEALTGLPASTDWGARGDDGIYVALKTHYPARKHYVEGADKMDRAILQLRNPLHALPSHASFIFEMKNGIPDHTVYAPAKFWTEWRDENFDAEMESWVDHLEYWVENYDGEKGERIVISYEDLIPKETGPKTTAYISHFLAQSEGVTTIFHEKIPCVWDKVVNYEKYNGRRFLNEFLDKNEEWVKRNVGKAKLMIEKYPEEIDSHVARKLFNFDDPFHPHASRRQGARVEYTFTEEQLETMLNKLIVLQDRYLSRGTEERLEGILSRYVAEVKEAKEEAAGSEEK